MVGISDIYRKLYEDITKEIIVPYDRKYYM